MRQIIGPMALALVFISGVSNTCARAVDREKLGRLYFNTSCSPETQKQFERALAMLHSFFIPKTIKASSAIPQTDPSSAIAYRGSASSQRPNPLVGPFDAATLRRRFPLPRSSGSSTSRHGHASL